MAHDSGYIMSEQGQERQTQTHGTYLNDIPSELSPCYRSVPLLLRGLLFSLSTAISVFRNLAGKHMRLRFIVLQSLLGTLVSNILVEDLLFAPSRIGTEKLASKYNLPSPLSQLETVVPLFSKHSSVWDIKDEEDLATAFEPFELVHYLRYDAPQKDASPPRFDVIHASHGFGASSLSWLPALPTLVDRLGARVGLAHDAPGFGFTSRPPVNRKRDLIRYTPATSAGLGVSIVQTVTGGAPAPSSVVLFGHSMGALSCVRMGLTFPESTKVKIVLVSPAVLFKNESTIAKKQPTITDDQHTLASNDNSAIVTLPKRFLRLRLLLEQLFFTIPKQILLEIPLSYFLKRLVGNGKLWRSGLRAAWGNPSRVTENDVKRFSWPSIGKGWEKGLINFALAMASCKESEVELLKRVVSHPNVSLFIVHGTKDNVVPISNSRRLVKACGGEDVVPLIEMPGLGHDPFEENVELFVSLVKDEIEKT